MAFNEAAAAANAMHLRSSQGPLERILKEKTLLPVYPPIAHLAKGGVYAHEALIRGPHTPPPCTRIAI